MKQLCDSMRAAPLIDPEKPILIPGEIEGNRRAQGIPIESKAFHLLQGLTRGEYDYEMPKF
jgi:LDH2 family malate/lactate/ureidoglycolate dehydrogenase